MGEIEITAKDQGLTEYALICHNIHYALFRWKELIQPSRSKPDEFGAPMADSGKQVARPLG